MRNKTYTRYIIASGLFVATFFLMLFNISDLTLGKGLGREVVILTNDIAAEYKYSFDSFKKYTNEHKIEYSYTHTDSERVLVEFSGVEDVERFTEDLTKHFPGLFIYELGTFNSISSINKTSNTIQSYFVVFFIGFITLWTYRYRLLGLYGGLVSVFNLLLTLNLTNRLGFLFDFNIWFTTLVLFIVHVLLKGWTFYKVYDVYDEAKIKRTYFMTVILLVGASLFLFMMDDIFHSSSSLIGFSAVILGFELVIIHFNLHQFEKIFLMDERFKPYIEKRSGINMPDMINDRVLMIMISLMLGVVSAISFVGFYQTDKHTPVFAQENILIVDNNDAITFLEVQASLGKYDLTKNLLEYKISEEKKTWFIFDEYTHWFNLRQVKSSIEDKLDVDVSVMKKEGEHLHFTPKAQTLLFAGFLAFNILVIYLLVSKEYSMQFLMMSIIFYGFLYFFKTSFNLNLSLQLMTLFILTPSINALSLRYLQKEQNILKVTTLASVLGYILTVLGLLVLPIVLFIPDLLMQHLNMMHIFIIFTLSYIATLFVIYLSMKKSGDIYDDTI